MRTLPHTGPDARDAERQARRPASRPLSLVTLLVVGVIVGLGGGRFLLASPSPEVASQPAPGGATAAERIAPLEARLEAEPDNPAGWRELAALHLTQASVTGDPSYHLRAQDAIGRAVETGGPDPRTTLVQSSLDLSLHQFDGAAIRAREVLAQVPASPDALAVLVDAEIETGRYEAAGEHLQQLLDQRPSLPALARTSYLRELSGDLPGAARAMGQAAAAGSSLPDELASVTVLLGDLQRRLGRLDAAEASLAEADRIRDGLPLAAVLRARLAVARGDLDDAIEELAGLTDRIPLPDALTLLQEIQSAAGRDEAAADTAEVIRTVAALQREAGQDIDLEMARFEADAGDPARAVRLARQAHATRPTVLAASALGWALHRAGDTEDAVPYARQSTRLGTPDAALAYRAAAILTAADRPEEAADALARAGDDHPSSTPRFADPIRTLAADLDVDLPAHWSQERP